jgi:hypothetical protein
MWTARCDQVHKKGGDDTITERERTYAKIKKFWVQHVGMRRMDRSMVEVFDSDQVHSKGGQSMSWGAQNRSKDAKTPSVGRGMSDKPEPGLWPIQPHSK